MAPEDCIEWGGGHGGTGYAMDYKDGKMRYLHRVLVGAPTDKEVDHLCCNRACIRIDHLEIVTKTENLRRAGATFRRMNPWCKTCGCVEWYYVRSGSQQGARRCKDCMNRRRRDARTARSVH